jgi:hypothetical protein
VDFCDDGDKATAILTAAVFLNQLTKYQRSRKLFGLNSRLLGYLATYRTFIFFKSEMC